MAFFVLLLYSVDLLGSFDPFVTTNVTESSPTVISTSDTTTNFEQIIDTSQTQIINEDAMNSNPPPVPFIAFEQNLNKKANSDTATVPGKIILNLV